MTSLQSITPSFLLGTTVHAELSRIPSSKAADPATSTSPRELHTSSSLACANHKCVLGFVKGSSERTQLKMVSWRKLLTENMAPRGMSERNSPTAGPSEPGETLRRKINMVVLSPGDSRSMLMGEVSRNQELAGESSEWAGGRSLAPESPAAPSVRKLCIFSGNSAPSL